MIVTELQLHDLDKYIFEDVPEPKDPQEKARWKYDRVFVDAFLGKTVVHEGIKATIVSMGWDQIERNPKKTFDIYLRAFEDGTPETAAIIHEELTTLRRTSYPDMMSFQLEAEANRH